MTCFIVCLKSLTIICHLELSVYSMYCISIELKQEFVLSYLVLQLNQRVTGVQHKLLHINRKSIYQYFASQKVLTTSPIYYCFNLKFLQMLCCRHNLLVLISLLSRNYVNVQAEKSCWFPLTQPAFFSTTHRLCYV